MKTGKKFLYLLLSATLSISTISCMEDLFGNDEPDIKATLTAEESADLDKMANTITNVMSIHSINELQQKLKKNDVNSYSDVCTSIATGIETCGYEYETGWLKDTTWLFGDAAKTILIDGYDAIPEGQYLYSCNHSVAHDEQYASDLYLDARTMYIDYQALLSDPSKIDPNSLLNSLDMTASGRGTINYFADNLLIEFYDVTMEVRGSRATGNYNFKIMDNKYDVSISYEFGLEKLLSDDQNTASGSSELMRGAITNNNNEQIGVFVLYEDESVAFFDNEGNSRKIAVK